MDKIIKINKKVGETPFQLLGRIRKENPNLSEIPMTYAGRLDPMAEGEMIILIGDECLNKEKYTAFDKEYISEIIFGINTDTNDLLGLVEGYINDSSNIPEEKIKEFIDKNKGKIIQAEPKFSSRNIKKNLNRFRMGQIAEDFSKEVDIYESEILGISNIDSAELLKYIQENISHVRGDFRQELILANWKKLLNDDPTNLFKSFKVLKIRLKVSSGFYVRSFARDIGAHLGVGAIAKSILRSKIFN